MAGRAFPGLLVGVVLLLLAWRVATLGAADHFALAAPERALGFRAAHPEANIALAERLVRTDPGSDRVAQLARAALASDPLDGRSYRLLARHAEARSDPKEASRLHFLAAATSPRDVPSRIWLANHFLASGDVAAAMGHMDFLLKVSPRYVELALSPLVGDGFDPGGTRAPGRAPGGRSLLASRRDGPHPASRH